MASRKEYEMLFQLNAQLGGSYNSTFKSAQGSIVSMQKEIAALSKTQSDISAYQKQQDAVENSRKKLETLQQQYDNIQKEMQETGTFSSSLENKLLAKQQQIDKTTASLDTQTAKLGQMGAALSEAGMNTDDLTKESAKLSDQLDELKQKQEAAADKASSFGSAASHAFGAVHQAIVAAGIAKALKEIYEQFMSCSAASMEYEQVMAGVRRTVGGTTKELAIIGAEFKAMSLDIPITTSELGKIAETSGQLGIAQAYINEFTEVMAMLATTTDLSSDNAATMLAQFANITGLDPRDYARLGSVVANLGDATATTASKVVNMSQGMAAAASIAGMSETDILGISAAVGSLGIEAQAGSTAMSTLIQTLYKAVETGNKLDEFAKIANVSASEFSQLWGDNAVMAMDAFIQGLNDTERNGRSAIVVLDELGITNIRQTKAILGLAQAGDLLSNTVNQGNRAWEENTALQEKANIMYSTANSQLVFMQNAYRNLQIAVGDNYMPVLQKLYAIGAESLNDLTEFVQQNPGLVKAVTAFAGILGTAVAALATYTLAVKIATAFSAAFAATAGVALGPIVLGVAAVAALSAGIALLTEASKAQTDEFWELTAASRAQYAQLQEINEEYTHTVEIYGEVSYEAQQLRWKIEDLSEEYEHGKQTLEEYTAAHKELMASYDDMAASHTESSAKISSEQLSIMALIGKLAELTATTDGAAKNKQAILAIVDALNESVPELALSYDSVISASDGLIESIYDIAQARAAQLQLEQEWSEYVDRVGQQDALKSAREAAEYSARIAQEEYALAHQAYIDAAELYEYDTSGLGMYFGTEGEAAALDAAQKHLKEYNTALDETTARYQENEEALGKLESAFRAYQAEQDMAAASGENIREIITDITDQMSELADKYKQAYDAALDSVSGQYNLWDQAAIVVATSAGTINKNLEDQIDYWQDYNANLASLTDRSADIEGLAEMISSFADGSNDSVSAVAGMAKANDRELVKMVKNWQTLQEEQKAVADSLAELEIDFANSMDIIQKELEDAIGEMSLGEEAAQSGRDTIQGFIDGAEDMMPAVEAAYKRIADAAMAAIDAQLDMHSPSRVMEYKAEMTWAGYINKTKAMQEDITAAMADAAGAGTEAVAAEEAQLIAFAPYLAALGAGVDAVSATRDSGLESSVVITVAPSYSITGVGDAVGIETVLREHSENLQDYILEVLENAGIDARRRAYA